MPFSPADRITIAKPVMIHTPTMISMRLFHGGVLSQATRGPLPGRVSSSIAVNAFTDRAGRPPGR